MFSPKRMFGTNTPAKDALKPFEINRPPKQIISHDFAVRYKTFERSWRDLGDSTRNYASIRGRDSVFVFNHLTQNWEEQ